MIAVKEYNLPDIQLMNEVENRFLLWIPDKPYIVLGVSNKVQDAVEEEPALRNKVCVMKRRTGGQTVVLTPNNIIISAVITDENVMKPKEVFNKFNDVIIKTIAKDHNVKFATRGISDIATGDKKILGSSMYRGKGKLFYHAVLNFNEPPTTFQKYLKHPNNEPDYRKGRMHHEFVTSLKETGYSKSMYHLKKELTVSLSSMWNNFETVSKSLAKVI